MPLRAGRARATRIPSGIAVTPELLNERVNDVLVVGTVVSVCVSTIISVRSVQRTRFLIEWQQAVSKTHSRPALTPSSTRANAFVLPKCLHPNEQTEHAEICPYYHFSPNAPSPQGCLHTPVTPLQPQSGSQYPRHDV